MKIASFAAGPLAENTYLLTAGDEALFVDPGTDSPWLRTQAARYAGHVRYILLTHGHADHLMAAAWLKDATGAPLAIHFADAAGLSQETVSLACDLFPGRQQPTEADLLLRGGEALPFAGREIRVIATPGHTAGGVCYQIDRFLLTGDTLFAGSMGRTDFPTGDARQMASSLALLGALPGDYEVYPGHGPATTLERERKMNPYLRELL